GSRAARLALAPRECLSLVGWPARLASSSPSLRRCPEQLGALKCDEERASAEPLFHLDADRRARQKGHRTRQLLEGTVAVGYAQPGDVIDRAVLQLVARAAVEHRIAERDVFRTIENLEDLVRQIAGKLVGQLPVIAQCDAQEIRAYPNSIAQRVCGEKPQRKLIQIDQRVARPRADRVSQNRILDFLDALEFADDAAFFDGQAVTDARRHESAFDADADLVFDHGAWIARQFEGRDVIEGDGARVGLAKGLDRAALRRGSPISHNRLGATGRAENLVAVKHDEERALRALRAFGDLQPQRRAWQERKRAGEQSERALAIALS